MNYSKHHRNRNNEESQEIILSEKASRFARKCNAVCVRKQRSDPFEESWRPSENSKNLYAIVPPMDKFMDVKEDESLNYIWGGFERGDLIIARITSIRETGFTGLVLAMDGGKSKHISQSMHIWCPVTEIPKKTNHEDVLLQFSDRDLVRCAIIDIKSELIVSLRKQRLKVPLGKIDDEDLPQAYQRSLTTSESYENILKKCVGFINPSSVKYLLKSLGVPGGPQMSLMKDLRCTVISRKEYAESIRKQQSKKVADASVKKGIKHFKDMEYELALQNFNYALDMDTDNVDGLVARGALYANRTCFAKAVRDFDVALQLEPEHKNAKKYLTEVLVERAKQIESRIEDVEQINEVKRCYQKALSIDPDCEEAKNALGQIEEQQRKSTKNDSSSNSESEQPKEKFASTAKKLKDILENDVSMQKRKTSKAKNRKKRSRKRRDSSLSSSSSSTSLSSSTSSTNDNQDKGRRHSLSSPQRKESRGKKRSRSSGSNEPEAERNSKVYSRRKSGGSSSSCDVKASSRKSAPSDMTRRKSSSNDASYPSTSKLGRSFTEERTRAVIRSNQGNMPYEKSQRNPRRPSNDIKNITKENFEDILLEISMFETTSKTKR